MGRDWKSVLIPFVPIQGAAGDEFALRLLSPRSILLLLAITGAAHWRTRWLNGIYSLTDAEAVLVEDWASNAESELLELAEGGTPGYPTPFWDEGIDVDDEETAGDQTWYGEVTDPNDAAGDLTFVENAAIWVITGFIAYSGDVGAAIFFHTIAPSFVLAWRAGDIGELFRIVIDSADYGTVDTTGLAGEVIRVPIMGDPTFAGHDIMLIKVS